LLGLFDPRNLQNRPLSSLYRETISAPPRFPALRSEITDVFSYVEVADGRVWLRPEGVKCFAGDLSEQEQKLVWATHAAPAADLFNQKAEGTAWRSKPSWYIVAQDDRTVQPELERFFAKRMGAKVTEVASSHVPMLSHPHVVIDVIRAAANAVQEAKAAA
jgi:pimeloyl-ACP methyl ester carboxylesterase